MVKNDYFDKFKLVLQSIMILLADIGGKNEYANNKTRRKKYRS